MAKITDVRKVKKSCKDHNYNALVTCKAVMISRLKNFEHFPDEIPFTPTTLRSFISALENYHCGKKEKATVLVNQTLKELGFSGSQIFHAKRRN